MNEKISNDDLVGYDPWLFTERQLKAYEGRLAPLKEKPENQEASVQLATKFKRNLKNNLTEDRKKQLAAHRGDQASMYVGLVLAFICGVVPGLIALLILAGYTNHKYGSYNFTRSRGSFFLEKLETEPTKTIAHTLGCH